MSSSRISSRAWTLMRRVSVAACAWIGARIAAVLVASSVSMSPPSTSRPASGSPAPSEARARRLQAARHAPCRGGTLAPGRVCAGTAPRRLRCPVARGVSAAGAPAKSVAGGSQRRGRRTGHRGAYSVPAAAVSPGGGAGVPPPRAGPSAPWRDSAVCRGADA